MDASSGERVGPLLFLACGRPNLEQHVVPVLTVLPLLTGVNQEEGDGEKNERTGPLGWVGTPGVFFCLVAKVDSSSVSSNQVI